MYWTTNLSWFGLKKLIQDVSCFLGIILTKAACSAGNVFQDDEACNVVEVHFSEKKKTKKTASTSQDGWGQTIFSSKNAKLTGLNSFLKIA